MDSTKSDKASADDAKVKSDLFNLVEKLRIELNVKDQELQGKDNELAKERQEKQELSANLDLAMSRADRQANQVNELENGLGNAQQIIRFLWESFPSPDLSYYIKTQSGSQNEKFLYIPRDYTGYTYNYLHSSSSADDRHRSEFKFTKNSDGSISISTMGKYLQRNTRSSRVEFTGRNERAGKFVLFYHQQNQQPAISIDICSLAGYFLCMDNNNYVVANSRTPPAMKFLIVPVGVQ